MCNSTLTPETITWSQFHECSHGLLFSTPQSMISDGVDLLALLQELGSNYGSEGGFKHIEPASFFNGLRIAEGLIRTGNGLIKLMEANHDD